MVSVLSPTILTIGHSNHSLERLIELLAMNGVTEIADVRSIPYSRRLRDLGREALQRALEAHGIAYVFLGRELGARSSDPSCYEDGRVQYRKLAETELFRAGLERVLADAASHRVALLCAEKEPLACHRTLLVGRQLEALGASIAHILADGTLEPHAEALNRLLAMLKMAEPELFRSRQELIEDAYARQGQRVAYASKKMRAHADVALG